MIINTGKISIIGRTYPVKDELKALGAKWFPLKRAWMVPRYNLQTALDLTPEIYAATLRRDGTVKDYLSAPPWERPELTIFSSM
jgi:hypothetical protein